MEPDKSYPLHLDQDDHNTMPQVPLADSTNASLLPPSTYDRTDDTLISSSDATPWYLRPLTKSNYTPLTTLQTRPYVPRAPLPYISTEKAAPLPPPTTMSPRVPKPFSQYTATTDAGMATDNLTKKSKNSRHRIGVWIVMLLIVGILGLGLYSASQWGDMNTAIQSSQSASITKEREQRLYHAIDLQMQTGYVRQIYDQTTNGPSSSVVTFDVLSDFSVPANSRSHIDYNVRMGSGDNATTGSGEIVILDKNEYFGKLTAPVLLYQGSDATRPQQGQWYKIASTDNTGDMLIDPLSTRIGLNNPMGEIIVGNFDESTRRELLQFIVGHKVYAIRSTDEVGVGVNTLTHYKIDFNAERANELNKKVAEKIGNGTEDLTVNFTQDDVKDMEVWIDNTSGRVVRMVFQREYARSSQASDSVSRETINVSLSYPQDGAHIIIPDGAIAVPWQANE